MEQEFLLQIKNQRQSKEYLITSAMRLIIGDKNIQMVETINATVTLLSYHNEKCIFHYKQTDYKRNSTNEDFFALTSIINSLLENFQIKCDKSGKIEQILITNEKAKGDEIYKYLLTKYQDRKNEVKELKSLIDDFISDKSKLVEQLNKSGFHRILFNRHYGNKIIGKAIEEKKVIEKLVNGIDVPVVLEKIFEVDEKEKNYTLKINGVLDIENFDKKTLVRWLKNITDTYNLKVDCGVEIEDIFVFDEDHWLQEADSYFSFLAANLYECSYAYKVVQVKSTSIHENKENTNKWITK